MTRLEWMARSVALECRVCGYSGRGTDELGFDTESGPATATRCPDCGSLELLDEDGMPVLHNDRPVIVGGEFEAGRPPGLAPGTPLTVPMAINFSALPARSGAAYTWRLAIDGTSEPDWRASFTVRPPKQQSA